MRAPVTWGGERAPLVGYAVSPRDRLWPTVRPVIHFHGVLGTVSFFVIAALAIYMAYRTYKTNHRR